MSRTQDNIYVNVSFNNTVNTITITNPDSSTFTTIDGTDDDAYYNSTKTQPILYKASDYYLSVIRFDIPLNEVPLFIMPIVPNQSDPNLTPLIVGISTTTVSIHGPITSYYPTQVEYAPDYYGNPPVQNIPNQQVITPYYYVYSYNNLIQAINLALSNSYSNAGSPGGDGFAPFFQYGPGAGYISLIVGTNFANGDYNVFCNQPANNYLDGIRSFFNGFNSAWGADFTFNTTPYPANINSLVVPVNGYTPGVLNGYIFTSEYSVINNWTSLKKIVLTSTNLPILKEFVPSFNQNGTQNDLPAGLPILTDFIPNIDAAGDTRSIVYYNPTSQYRLIDLYSDGEIKTIDIRIQWQDRFGNLYPVEITNFQQANVKLAFVSKQLYKNTSLNTIK